MEGKTQENEQEFSGRFTQMVEYGFSCLSVAVGHNLGLFDLMSKITDENSRKTSQEIADAGHFKERYVREWLGALVCARIVECDPTGKEFWLPKVMGTPCFSMWSMSMLFYHTSAFMYLYVILYEMGVSYEKFKGFSDFMASVSSSWQQKHLLPNFIPNVPNMIEILESGGEALDVGCGYGTPSLLLAQRFPNSTFWGIDFCTEAIESAKNSSKFSNLHFEIMDAATLHPDWSGKFDYITAFDAIHDQAYPDLVLREIYRVLKPGGRFSMVDLRGYGNPYLDRDHTPLSALNYSASLFHCMTVSLYFEGGMGLGNRWGTEKAKQMLGEAGFKHVDIVDMGFVTENCHFLCTKE